MCLVSAGSVAWLFSDCFLWRCWSRISVTATSTRQGPRSTSCVLIRSSGRRPRVCVLEPCIRDRHGECRRRRCHIHARAADEHTWKMFSIRPARGHCDAWCTSGNSCHLQQSCCRRFWRRLLFSDRWITSASQDNFSVRLTDALQYLNKDNNRIRASVFLFHADTVCNSGIAISSD